MTVTNYRDHFPMVETKLRGHPLVYFDSAATAFKPQSVIDAVTDFYTNQYGTVNRAIYGLAVEATERYNEGRKKVAHFLNARSEKEIIFCRGTTEAINLAATTFGEAYLSHEDEVIVAETEHHSNIVPWQLVCARHGARLKVLPVDDRGVLILDQFEEMLSGRTRIVALAHISNALGTIHPIKQVIEIAHRAGAKVLIDGAQAVPHMAVDVQDLDCDFYAFSGHKLYGPTGIGALYCKEEILCELPPYQGGGDMIEKVTFEETTYNTLPNKFEAGTPNIAGVIGLSAAIDFIDEVGIDKIQSHENELLAHATEKLLEIEGLHIFGPTDNKGALISFGIHGVHPLDIGTLLDLHGIAIRTGHLCSQPTMNRFGVNSMARVSFALYNTIDEIDQFVTSLKKVLERLH